MRKLYLKLVFYIGHNPMFQANYVELRTTLLHDRIYHYDLLNILLNQPAFQAILPN